tara:strand:+ start:9688 stop:10785 length:1098 start_codon:yes stop_codon:yes gene_type:complete
MNISDMHISVQQGVDKFYSQQADILLPEEIDLELNKNIQRFVNQRFNSKSNRYQEGFEESQKRIDDLRSLVTESSRNATFKGEVFQNIFCETSSFPDDYLFLINLKSLVQNQKCKTFCSAYEDIPYTTTKVTWRLDECYNTAWDGVGLWVKFDGDNTYTQITNNTNQQSTTVTQALQQLANPANWTHNSILSATFQGQQITLEFAIGTLINTSDPGYHTYNNGSAYVPCEDSALVSTPPLTNPKRVPCDDVETTTLVGQNKFAQHDDIFKLLSDPFNKTTYKSPLYTIRDNAIDIYSDDTFIIDRIKMTYLRQPVEVDFTSSPQVDCDLPEHTHQEIVDMTINSILEGISDPRYQSSNMEVLKSE